MDSSLRAGDGQELLAAWTDSCRVERETKPAQLDYETAGLLNSHHYRPVDSSGHAERSVGGCGDGYQRRSDR